MSVLVERGWQLLLNNEFNPYWLHITVLRYRIFSIVDKEIEYRGRCMFKGRCIFIGSIFRHCKLFQNQDIDLWSCAMFINSLANSRISHKCHVWSPSRSGMSKLWGRFLRSMTENDFKRMNLLGLKKRQAFIRF